MNHTYDTTFKLYIYKDKQNKMHFKELSNSAKKKKRGGGGGGGGGGEGGGGGAEKGEKFLNVKGFNVNYNNLKM